ncbi:MAG TPA: oligosaccharide flippase family protein [Burkholderiaceae bacterium]|nr:oligosaccharide flippase family protein [Burkholderiaceae bacterium]
MPIERTPAGEHYYSLARFRSNLLSFAAGRTISALTSFAIFVLLARSLPVADYGRYLTLLATTELILLYSSLGIPWVAIRFVPEYRERASSRQLYRLLAGMALANLLPMLAVLVLLWRWSGWWTNRLALDAALVVVGPFLLLCLFDGLNRIFVTLALEPLLAQKSAQAVQISRNLVFLAPLAYAAATGMPFDLPFVIHIEAAAAAVAAAIAAATALSAARRSARLAGDPEWAPPPLRALVGVAGYNYSGNAVANLYAAPSLQLIANALLGPAASALFGFARGLAAQVRRYLPSELLLSIIRPMLVAAYSNDGDHHKLNRRMLLAAKSSLLAVAPLVGILLGAGPQAAAAIGGADLQHAYWLIIMLLLLSFAHSHRSLLGLYVNCVRETDIWLRASLLCLCVLPATYLMILGGWGASSMAIAMVLEEVLLTASVLRMLQRRGYRYSLAFSGGSGIAAATAICALTVFVALRLPELSLPVAAVLGGIAFVAALALLVPLDRAEQRLVNQLAGRPMFRQV